MATRVLARELAVGDVIRPPEREMRLWMRRTAAEKELTDDALWMTVEDVRRGAPDKHGEWLIVTARPVPAWGNTATWNIKMRPETRWPRRAESNPITHRKALRYAKALAAHERASVQGKNPTRKAQAFIGRKIRRLAHEGMQAPRRIAAAYSLARRAGFRSVPKRTRKNPRGISEGGMWLAVADLARSIEREAATERTAAKNAESIRQYARELQRFSGGMRAQLARGIHENPTLAVLGNPPAKVVGTLSHRLYELRYKHAEDGKDYRHPFGPGAAVKLLADGSVWICARHRLWEDH